MTARLAILASLGALSITACGTTERLDHGPLGGGDAGPFVDGGPARDDGPAVDGGPGIDGGPAPDGGPGPDGGPAPDGGPGPDGGPAPDGGAVADGGLGLDGGADGGACPDVAGTYVHPTADNTCGFGQNPIEVRQTGCQLIFPGPDVEGPAQVVADGRWGSGALKVGNLGLLNCSGVFSGGSFTMICFWPDGSCQATPVRMPADGGAAARYWRAPEQEVHDVGSATQPTVGMDDDGNAVVVWVLADVQRGVVESRRYAMGQGWGGVVPLSPATGRARSASVAVSAAVPPLPSGWKRAATRWMGSRTP